MAVKKKAQIRLDDNMVDNPELLAVLEERQRLKGVVSEYRKKDNVAKSMIEKANLPIPCRVGRFVIERIDRPPHTVSFETEAGSTLSIKTADE